MKTSIASIALMCCAGVTCASVAAPGLPGPVVKPDTSTSVQNLDAAALYEHARSVEAQGNLKAAEPWYLLSAQAGYGPAQKRLGNMYGGEKNIPRDYVKAIYWQRRARDTGESVDLPFAYQIPGSPH